MKKRTTALEKDIKITKEIFIAEEKVILGFFNWEIKKRHFYSLASIIFTLSLGLFIVKNIKLSKSFIFIVFIISLIITSLIIGHRIKKHRQKITLLNILKQVIPFYTIALLFAFIYYVLNFLISGYLLGFSDVVFLVGIVAIFETITYHIH